MLKLSDPPPLLELESQNSAPTPRYRYTRRRWHLIFGVIDTLGALVMSIVHRWFGRPWFPLDKVRSILLIQLDHLGDALLTTAMISSIRRRWPQARIEVLAASWNQEIFNRLPEIDAVHVSNVNRFRRPGTWLWPLALPYWSWRLRQHKFDLAIDVRGELPHALLMQLAGCKRRAGWPAGGGGFLLTDHAEYVADRHELDNRRALLEMLSVELSAIEDFAPRFATIRNERRAMTTVWNEASDTMSSDSVRPRIVFHVGAGTAAKRWPVGHAHELLGRLVVELDATVALVGSASERSLAAEITGGRVWPHVVDLTGRLTLGELAALCEGATLFIGADSGPAHLAAAVKTPVVTLFSGTNRPEQWQPRGERVAVVRHSVACSPCHRSDCPLADHPCMRGIAAAEVIRAVRALMATRSDSVLNVPATRTIVPVVGV